MLYTQALPQVFPWMVRDMPLADVQRVTGKLLATGSSFAVTTDSSGSDTRNLWLSKASYRRLHTTFALSALPTFKAEPKESNVP